MTYYSKVIIMGTLKYIILLGFICFFTNCYQNQYTEYEESFFSIYLKEWNSSICPKKVVFEKYLKDSNFKKKILSNSDFDIDGCKKIESQFNQRLFTPNAHFHGQITYDVRIIVDDSLEYKITEIQDKIDTIADIGRKKWIIMNNIKSLVVNGHKLDNTKAPLNIDIPTKLGKVMKK